MDNPFKVGDRVRRTGPSFLGLVTNGNEYVVNGVLPRQIRVDGDGGYWHANKFELVTPAAKTDEELAAEYRAARKALIEAGEMLRKRGYVLRRNGDVLHPSKIEEKITIKKVVTTTKEI